MQRIGAVLLILLASVASAQHRNPPTHYPYARGCSEALSTGKPLLVFVGMRPTVDVEGAVYAKAESLEGFGARCIVVSVPDKGYMYWAATLKASSSKEQIEQAIWDATRKQVAVPAADPFRVIKQPSRVQQHCPT